MMILLRVCLAFFPVLWFVGEAGAEVSLQITEGVQGATPIAVVPFGGPQTGENIASIVAADLERSGRFKALPTADMLEQPNSAMQVRMPTWQALGQEYLVVGQVQPGGGDQKVAKFSVLDVLRGSSVLEYQMPYAAAEQRRAAHRIADLIYKQLTGEAGDFAAPVAFVTSSGTGPGNRKYTLQIADADGFAPQGIISSKEPIMSPAWSPDGSRIAYVSFEDKRAAVFVQSLASGERTKVSESPGINGAPAWSPDGRELALTLSKDGNPNVYLMDIGSRSMRRLTDHTGIDTEPNFSPDGRSIVFTSDRGGRPQLYLAPATGGEAQRLTFDGDYNARGVFSPDGRYLAFVHAVGGSYRIAVMELANRKVRFVSNGPLDESPGFSPSGRTVLYSARTGGVAQLLAVPVGGGTPRLLQAAGGEVRQPAWSPRE
jgi:TolB protein